MEEEDTKIKKLFLKMYKGFPNVRFDEKLIHDIVKTKEDRDYFEKHGFLLKEKVKYGMLEKEQYSLGPNALELISSWKSEEVNNKMFKIAIGTLVITILMFFIAWKTLEISQQTYEINKIATQIIENSVPNVVPDDIFLWADSTGSQILESCNKSGCLAMAPNSIKADSDYQTNQFSVFNNGATAHDITIEFIGVPVVAIQQYYGIKSEACIMCYDVNNIVPAVSAVPTIKISKLKQFEVVRFFIFSTPNKKDSWDVWVSTDENKRQTYKIKFRPAATGS